jgi:hypothetical protein
MSQSFVATNFFNPAAVGFGDNNQFQSFYRNQFSGVGDPFRTVGVGVDFALFKNEDNDYFNNFGLGLQGVSDQVLNGILQKNEITLSLANRVFLNRDRTSYLALGIDYLIVAVWKPLAIILLSFRPMGVYCILLFPPTCLFKQAEVPTILIEVQVHKPMGT